jgi:glucose-6-phosphate isomerase
MVVLPYKDRLELFSKYLQQLVMESLGKEKDADGNVVNQGLAVLGNKGSTDQHAYIQQLRDGLNNFFALFIEVQKDQLGEPIYTEPDATSGDFLEGFFLGTRAALAENNRVSVTLTVKEVDPATVGLLICLFERAVGFYASLVNINAYHQPGVEAGKKAAGNVLAIQREIINHLRANLNHSVKLDQIVKAIGRKDDIETVFKVVEHLAANPLRRIKKKASKNLFEARYKMV